MTIIPHKIYSILLLLVLTQFAVSAQQIVVDKATPEQIEQYRRSKEKTRMHMMGRADKANEEVWSIDMLPMPIADSINIAMLLPFSGKNCNDNISLLLYGGDLNAARKLRLDDNCITALDFYQGVLIGLKYLNGPIKFNLSLFDTGNSDSVVNDLIQRGSLKNFDIIIGPGSNVNAKAVSDYCRNNRIWNIQPFSPSKSAAVGNPYHIKIAPTLDAHLDMIFRSLIDSFTRANIILYSQNNGEAQYASRIDSLLTDYRLQSTTKLLHKKWNPATLASTKKSLNDLLRDDEVNVVVITSLDESFVQTSLRQLSDASQKKRVVVYGMPTWLDSELLRLDYLNAFETRFTDLYYLDTLKDETATFLADYRDTYEAVPGRFSVLGYDIITLLDFQMQKSGREFVAQLPQHPFGGIGHFFQFRQQQEMIGGQWTPTYRENSFLHLYAIKDYTLHRVW